MAKIYVMGFILFTGLLVWWGTACSTNGTIFLNISNSSTNCTVTCTLDGGSPITNSGNGGPYTLWSNVSHGNHKIGVSGPYETSYCNYDITGGGQTIDLNYPCANTIGGVTGFTISCN
jgi:hypothetical protein